MVIKSYNGEDSMTELTRRFYELYPIPQAVPAELSWTHFCFLLKIDNTEKRSFYEIETISNNWSTRELERQINSLLYERLAISKDKNAVQELAIKGLGDSSLDLALDEISYEMQKEIDWHKKRESKEFNKEQSFE